MMNKLLMFALLLVLSSASFANKRIITGYPIVLEKQDDVYYTPGDYRKSKTYYYVIVDGKRKICYLAKQSFLSALNSTLLEVNDDGSILNWYCYPFDNNYFEMR
jgi:hypothetical protein